MPLLLSEDDVRRLIEPSELVSAMREALAAFSAGEAVQPVRTILQVGAERALFGLMPAYMAALPALGTKLVTVFAANTRRGLPTHLATILLFSPETGALLAVMDGRYITEVRTAAVSAVSVELLARSRASILAILGSGVQARSHLDILCRTGDFQVVRVWSPTPANRNRFASEAAARSSVSVKAIDSAEEATREADVIVLATSSSTPVIHNGWVRDGAHVISLGGIGSTQREMDPALVARGQLIVDSRSAALVESGDIVLGIREGLFSDNHIHAELGEVVRGKRGRVTEEDVTIFKSLGLAVEDV